MSRYSDLMAERKQLADSFPESGAVRAKQVAAFLGIGLSTLWSYASDKDGRIKKPTKLSPKISVWDAAYIRDIALNGFGIPGAE